MHYLGHQHAILMLLPLWYPVTKLHHWLTASFSSFTNIIAAFKEGKPSEGDLDELAIKIAAKWQKLGRHLGICQDVLDDIEANETEKPYRMLLRWRDTTTSSVLYEDLYHALCHPRVGLNNLAKEFCCKDTTWCTFLEDYIVLTVKIGLSLILKETGKWKKKWWRIASLCILQDTHVLFSNLVDLAEYQY